MTHLNSLVKSFALAIAALAVLACGASAQNIRHDFKIAGPDGSPVANHRISAEQAAAVAKLPGAVALGNPNGDVTIAQFYDLNCPYCRRASADVEALLRSDKNLKLILVPFPVLGVPSIQAGRVELGVRALASPETFFAFHRKIYEARGTIDGNKALAAAQALKIDQERLLAVANDDSVTETMKAHVRLGNAINLFATPSYVIRDVAIVGHPGEKSLRAVIASVRKCGQVVC
jgi:protein-disulfide isomerase